MTITNESKWRDPFEFFENPWFKDATQQLCIDGWPAFIVILNGKIREAREHRDELRTQLAAAKEENMQLWAAVNCKEDSGQIKQRMRFAAEITKLTEENARLKSAEINNAKYSGEKYGQTLDEISKLKEKLRVAKEDFKRIHYNNYRGVDQSVELRNIAQEALAKLESDNG